MRKLPVIRRTNIERGLHLVAHPQLGGFFQRTVILILDYQQQHTKSSETTTSYGTYGLVVNRNMNIPFKKAIAPLPADFADTLGNLSANDGGPVHMNIQLLHRQGKDQQDLEGIPLVDDVHYCSKLSIAAKALKEGTIPESDMAIFVGASVWSVGQLEN